MPVSLLTLQKLLVLHFPHNLIVHCFLSWKAMSGWVGNTASSPPKKSPNRSLTSEFVWQIKSVTIRRMLWSYPMSQFCGCRLLVLLTLCTIQRTTLFILISTTVLLLRIEISVNMLCSIPRQCSALPPELYSLFQIRSLWRKGPHIHQLFIM